MQIQMERLLHLARAGNWFGSNSIAVANLVRVGIGRKRLPIQMAVPTAGNGRGGGVLVSGKKIPSVRHRLSQQFCGRWWRRRRIG